MSVCLYVCDTVSFTFVHMCAGIASYFKESFCVMHEEVCVCVCVCAGVCVSVCLYVCDAVSFTFVHMCAGIA